KPTSGIERTFRRVAHGIAGIPRNLEEIQVRVRAADLKKMVDSELATNGEDNNRTSDLYEIARDRAKTATDAAQPYFSAEHEIENFGRSLEKVHCLFNWTLGYDGECIWISEPTRQITSLFQSIDLEYRRLCNDIEALVLLSQNNEMTATLADQAIDKQNIKDRWRLTINSVQDLERRLSIVISLLLINKPDVDLTSYPLLNGIRDLAIAPTTSGEPKVADVLWHALILGYAMAFVPVLLIKVGVRLWRAVTSKASNASLEFPFVAELDPWSRLSSIPGEFMSKSERWKYISSSLDDTLVQLMDYSLIFGCAIVVALLVRNSQISLHRWHSISDKKIEGYKLPIANYISVAFISYLTASTVYLLWRFLVHNIINPLQDGTNINFQLTVRTFGEYLPGIFMETLTVFPCVWFVLAFADQARWKFGRYADRAITYAVICAAIVFLQKLLRFDFPLSTSLFAAPATPFVAYTCMFMAFARVYEFQKEGWNRQTFRGSKFKSKLQKNREETQTHSDASTSSSDSKMAEPETAS
ncbi:MAG: hypothetical protein KTR32_11820, partial [Granulosicoccus sp.]|nr:hypothetical protein [Granulosicoccus sp.]